METHFLGQTDLEVSLLGVGGSELQRVSASEGERIIRAAMDVGVNVIDTAECYGESETIIGQALSGLRDDIFLFSKCGHAAGLPYTDWDAHLFAESIERSLLRLQTEYLDLIHLHSCPIEVLQRGDVMLALEKVRQEGKVRYIGYSGNNEAARYAAHMGIFDTVQFSVNLADQQEIERLLPLLRDQLIGGIAKRPLANVAWRQGLDQPPEDPYHYVYWKRLQALNYDFLAQGLEYSVEVALRFTLSIPNIQLTIVGTSQPERWKKLAEIVQRGPLPHVIYEAIRRHWQSTALPHWIAQV
ncbi:MAG TPA: aldo/keto reductase [Ktedonobacteraceae bacterium]|nr:aldo/keto reductase [Ktedonobacteraceae bacterium]